MPNWRNRPSMPNVRLSSGTIGTMRLPIVLVAQQRRQHAHEGHGGRDLATLARSPAAAPRRPRAAGPAAASRCGGAPARQPPSAARRSCRYFISGLSSGRLEERDLRRSRRRRRDLEAVAERLQRVVAELLRLVRDVLPFAGLAQAVALDGLGENDGRLAVVFDGRLVGRVDLKRVVAAAVQRQISSSVMSATSAASRDTCRRSARARRRRSCDLKS